jgi:hypothetical protein
MQALRNEFFGNPSEVERRLKMVVAKHGKATYRFTRFDGVLWCIKGASGFKREFIHIQVCYGLAQNAD